jgi:Ca2+-binding RTX toxin-like protein
MPPPPLRVAVLGSEPTPHLTSTDLYPTGIDNLRLGNGSNVLIGGARADSINTGSGIDTVCGDHCQMVFSNTLGNALVPQIQTIQSTCAGTAGGIARK